MTDTIQIRQAVAAEHIYVRDTWVRTFGPRTRRGWGGDPFIVTRSSHVYLPPNHCMSPPAWYAMHRAWVTDLLSRDNVTTLVACHRKIPDEVLGWLVYQHDQGATLHYAYVREAARRSGIGRRLLRASGARDADEVRTSHMTPDGEALLNAVFGEEAAA